MITVREVENFLYDWAPAHLAAGWDNVGLLVGSPDRAVTKILTALDITESVVDEAVQMGADLVVAHHPVMNCTWHPVQTLRTDDRQGRILTGLVENHISAICILQRRAEEILSLVDRTQRELIEQDELVEGRIVIGGGELAAMQVLTEMIEEFHKKYPFVTFDIFTGNADLVKEQMEKGLIDIGILLEPIDMEKFEFIRLHGKERWIVLMSPDDPLTEKESVNAKDLENMPLILPRRTNVQNELSNWLGNSFQEQQVLFTSNLTTNSALIVQRGLAYSIVIEGSIPFWDKEKIAYRPLSPELTANSVLAWKKQQPFSLATTKFIEYTKCFLGITEA